MTAQKIDFTLEKYATFTFVGATAEGTDLTGYTAKMHIRTEKTADSILMELTTENGRIIIDGPNGTITPKITDEDTATLPGDLNTAYDLVITSPAGDAYRVLQGAIWIEEGSTK